MQKYDELCIEAVGCMAKFFTAGRAAFLLTQGIIGVSREKRVGGVVKIFGFAYNLCVQSLRTTFAYNRVQPLYNLCTPDFTPSHHQNAENKKRV